MIQTEEMALQAATAAAAVIGSGRATHRGQGEPRPGTDVAAVQRGLGAMKLDTGNRGGGGLLTRRRGALLFISEPHTKPEHITDKTGVFMKLTQYIVL
jgi:hypothetical protein